MLRIAFSFLMGLLAMQGSAHACRVFPPNAPGIIFRSPPPDVREGLSIIEVVFEDVNAFPDRRTNVGRARVLSSGRGEFRRGDQVLVRMPAGEACQRGVNLGERGYIVGRTVRQPGFLLVFEPAYDTMPQTWR